MKTTIKTKHKLNHQKEIELWIGMSPPLSKLLRPKKNIYFVPVIREKKIRGGGFFLLFLFNDRDPIFDDCDPFYG